MTLDRHKNMAELNRLMGFQPSLDICPMAIHNKQTIKKLHRFDSIQKDQFL
jgi:hypothetical protein